MNVKTAVPLRVDFAGSWLDVPALVRPGAYIVNCAIQPLVSLARWGYEQSSGLGGSAAWAALNGANPIDSDLKSAGWQDPAVILETGLCIWHSGPRPVLEAKFNPDWLKGRMALVHTGRYHRTADIITKKRDYASIEAAARIAYNAVYRRSIEELSWAMADSYKQQIQEGMEHITLPGWLAAKYCGSGHGGYLLCLFKYQDDRTAFLKESTYRAMAIEPYLRSL